MVFSSPGEAFQEIAARPRWWVPVLLIGLVSTIYSLAFAAKVGFDRGIRQIIESSPQAANLTPPQIEAAAARGAQIGQLTGYFAIITTAVGFLIVALVLKLLFDVLLGADIGLHRMMGIVGYANLPMLLYTGLVLLVLNLKAPEDFSLANPLAFNVGAFLPSGSSAWLRSLGSSLDLFSFWVMGLMAVGVSAASRKISFGKALGGVVVCWGTYVCLKVGALALQTGRG